MSKKKHRNNKKHTSNSLNTPSSTAVFGQPHDVQELLLKYGTYNIQPTADSDNDFPHIAQGLPHNQER